MKRIIDLLGALLLFIIFSPLFIVIPLLIKYKLGSPILFKQLRPGLNEKPFYLYKFRSMEELKDLEGKLLPDSSRTTYLGSFLRKYSLDELPQLINVLKGELSLVGPRPLLMDYLPLYSKEQAKRHQVKPGITGWAQVNGRNAISWEEKFTLDVWYVDNHSLLLDLKIFCMTCIKVIRSDDVNVDVPDFTGTNNNERECL
ncbi:sugar transferase [Bacillus sp. UMB0728]|uniref:sugar transferase n=1 Tax=Bacillus sp. UMB0728 TaxID=2066052 RepID=UPI000C772BB0|nr:sugar transferase [Bacillus sp. UMB0728]PLR73522.1 sugar transferase [Bacillus sp. UMB0728]